MLNGENRDLPADQNNLHDGQNNLHDGQNNLHDGQNNLHDGQNEGEVHSPPGRQRSFFFKLITLFVFVIFIVLVLGSLLDIFILPSPNFLVESQRLSQDPLVQELKQAVVRITVSSRTQTGVVTRQQSGTGFNIRAEGLIVTNRHLVEDAAYLTVSFSGREKCRVVDWSINPAADLALITLESGDFPFVDLESEALLPVGEQVTIIGNPLNYYRVAIRGEISGYWRLHGLSRPVLEIDAPVYQGSSGSPVFNKEGKVVAVIYATAERQGEEGTRGLALPVAFLEDIFISPDN